MMVMIGTSQGQTGSEEAAETQRDEGAAGKNQPGSS